MQKNSKGFLGKVFNQFFSKSEAPSKLTPFQSISLNMEAKKFGDILNKGIRKPTNISFKMLRQVAKSDAVTRICINVIKKSVSQAEWKIRIRKSAPIQDEKVFQEEMQKAYDLFEFMNSNGETMRVLLERVIEDILVLDAGAIEIVRGLGTNEIMGLNSIDGATIRPIYNAYGVLGNAEGVAYKQFVNDKEVASFTQDELVYIMANPQNDIDLFGYGMSPIESIMLQVQASLEAELHNIKAMTGNNVPPGLLDLGDITDEEAEGFIALWNATVIGNTSAMKFIWGSEKQNKYIPFKDSNKDMEYNEYINWLSRIKLATYGLSGIDANMVQDVNRATAEVQSAISASRGVRSMKQLIEEYFTRSIIWKLGENFRYLEFAFEEQENLGEKKVQAEIDTMNIKAGVYTARFVQMRDNLPAIEEYDEAANVELEDTIEQEMNSLKDEEDDTTV